ncbi:MULTISPECIES: DUF2564 family protein [Geobacillus]|uniref:Cytosolic protein n=1 Tax=Geobacillus thermocatenulatus TaxID=33938 RepID=A0A226Q2B8_9BACL|nr:MULTISPECIES: DUF2564 family protein [Geobacillus]KPC99613.1 hypothetical protein LR69_02170 [Geobacillus sp. BCO2]RAN23420.1 cytosolic protein [Geobacillus sp. A8]ASS99818.1 cytosolic protein [Geobacillus thermocatenulatus]KLR72722.1 cytosolic protein [Geobacillus sp. T6]OXB86198.1 cytosolic protein [Geobacillus thermocatenulatus]
MARRDADVHTGYNDVKQVEMFVETAEKMVGQATMQLDPEMLNHAKEAIENARGQLARARQQATGVDGDFLAQCEQKLARAEHQLREAQQ